MNRLFLLLICCSVTSAARAGDEPVRFAFDPSLPYLAERRNPVDYDVDFSVVVTPPYQTKKLQVWLPLPGSDAGQQVRERRLSTFPLQVEPQIGVEPTYGNQFACFEFDAPQGAQIIRHQFRIQVWELHWNIDPAKVTTSDDWPSTFDPYRRGDSQSVVVDGRFHTLLDEIIDRRTAPYRQFGDVINWVQNNLEYDHHDASLRASAEHALLRRRGHCSDYHGFCAAMGRAMGMPTRITYGINTFAKNSPSHCKLEAFLPPYGWVSFDVSETQKLINAIRRAEQLDDEQRQRLVALGRERLTRGFRDNTWFVQTRGADYDLAPKASQRVPVVRTAYIEADGVPLPEPDPSDPGQRAFSWMTVHDFRTEQPPRYPFADWSTLLTNEDQP